jgi:hypothetical protein
VLTNHYQNIYNLVKIRKKHHLLIILALMDLAVEKENFFVGGK